MLISRLSLNIIVFNVRINAYTSVVYYTTYIVSMKIVTVIASNVIVMCSTQQ